MTEPERILDLSTLIRKGDVLVLHTGNTYIAGGEPSNPSEHLRRHRAGLKNQYRYSLWLMGWLVSVLMETCWIPVSLNAVVQVEREGKVIWDTKGGRSGQMELI